MPFAKEEQEPLGMRTSPADTNPRGASGATLPGLTDDETHYFQWLLCRKLGQTSEQQWNDLTMLNQKTLKAMAEQAEPTGKTTTFRVKKGNFGLWMTGLITALGIGGAISYEYGFSLGMAVFFMIFVLVDIRGQLGRESSE